VVAAAGVLVEQLAERDDRVGGARLAGERHGVPVARVVGERAVGGERERARECGGRIVEAMRAQRRPRVVVRELMARAGSRRLTMTFALLALAASHAAAAPTSKVAPMQLLDDDVCALLRSNTTDRCKAIAKSPLATVYQSGTKRGIRRFILAIERGDRTLVGPAIDVVGDSATVPTLHAITVHGRAAIAMDLASFVRLEPAPGIGASGTTHTIVGCATTAAGAWKCTQVELACEPTIGDDGSVESACGGRTTLAVE